MFTNEAQPPYTNPELDAPTAVLSGLPTQRAGAAALLRTALELLGGSPELVPDWFDSAKPGTLDMGELVHVMIELVM